MSIFYISLLLPIAFITFFTVGIFFETEIIESFIPTALQFVHRNFSHFKIVRKFLEDIDRSIKLVFYTTKTNSTGSVSFFLKDKKYIIFMFFTFYIINFIFSVVILLRISDLFGKKRMVKQRNKNNTLPDDDDFHVRESSLSRKVHKALLPALIFILLIFINLINAYIFKVNNDYLLRYVIISCPSIFLHFYASILSFKGNKKKKHRFVNFFGILHLNSFIFLSILDFIILISAMMLFTKSFFPEIRIFDKKWINYVFSCYFL